MKDDYNITERNELPTKLAHDERRAIDSVAEEQSGFPAMQETTACDVSEVPLPDVTTEERDRDAGCEVAGREAVNDVATECASMSESVVPDTGSQVPSSSGRGAVVAKVVRGIFHPMLISVYLSMLILFGRMMTLHMSDRLNIHVLAIIVLNTIIIPCVYILLLRTARTLAYGRHWRGFTAGHERMLLILILVVGFGVCAWNFKGVELLFMFRRVMFALMACTALGFLLDRLGRADFHMLGMGAMTGAVWILIYAGYVKMVIPFCIILMCSSLVAAATIWLERSTLMRVSANYLLAAVLTSFMILIA